MQEISPIKKRILQYIDDKNISKYKFYQESGITRGVLDKTSGISEDNIAKFIAYTPDVNPEWLLTGKGEMLKKEEREILAINNSIPLVSIEAVAGFGSDDWSISTKDIQGRYVVPDFNGIDFMMYVKGNSMYPKYSSGDIIACRKVVDNSFFQWNKTYVVATRSHGILVKRLHPADEDNKLRMVSDNKDYPPFDVDKEEITGIALVVGVIRLE